MSKWQLNWFPSLLNDLVHSLYSHGNKCGFKRNVPITFLNFRILELPLHSWALLLLYRNIISRQPIQVDYHWIPKITFHILESNIICLGPIDNNTFLFQQPYSQDPKRLLYIQHRGMKVLVKPFYTSCGYYFLSKHRFDLDNLSVTVPRHVGFSEGLIRFQWNAHALKSLGWTTSWFLIPNIV